MRDILIRVQYLRVVYENSVYSNIHASTLNTRTSTYEYIATRIFSSWIVPLYGYCNLNALDSIYFISIKYDRIEFQGVSFRIIIEGNGCSCLSWNSFARFSKSEIVQYCRQDN